MPRSLSEGGIGVPFKQIPFNFQVAGAISGFEDNWFCDCHVELE